MADRAFRLPALMESVSLPALNPDLSPASDIALTARLCSATFAERSKVPHMHEINRLMHLVESEGRA